MSDTKQCIECSRVLALTEFWTHNRSGDGLYHRCIECAKPRLGPNATVIDADGEGLKFCPTCKHVLPKSTFHRNKTSTDGLQCVCKYCQHKPNPDETHRQCKDCKETFPMSGFHRCLGGHQRRCKPCALKRGRISKFMTKYGITLEQYEAMVEAQSGVCFLCGKREKRTIWGKIPHLSVDHNHATGAVRKLLCFACNQGIGLFQEDTALLQRVIKYLDDHRGAAVT